MSQFDLFGDPVGEATASDDTSVHDEHAAKIAELPEALRPNCAPSKPRPEGGAQLDAWTRETQRLYLLYLIGAIQRLTYRESSLANIGPILMKLNGLGGEW